MNVELTHNQVLEMLPAYALGALDPEEMLAVDTYLTEHPELLTRLEAIEEAIAPLTILAPEKPLPSGGKRRLLNRVHNDLENQAIEEAAKSDLDSRHPLQPPAETETVDRRPASSAREATWPSKLWPMIGGNGWTIVAAGAIAASIIVLVYTGRLAADRTNLQSQIVTLQSDKSTLEATINTLTANNDTLKTTLDQLQTDNDALKVEVAQSDKEIESLQVSIRQLSQDYNALLAQHRGLQTNYEVLQAKAEALATAQDRLTFLANAPRIAVVSGTDHAPNASGTFYAADNGRMGLFVLRDLETLPDDETYQLWVIPPNQAPVSVGLIDNVETGQPSWNEVEIPATGQGFAAVGVSREPAGGSPSPTTIVLLGNMS